MKKSHIRKAVLCLSLTALISTAAEAQSLFPDRLSGITQGQLSHTESWMNYEHLRQLFSLQNGFPYNPYLETWSERASSRSYQRSQMERLLRTQNTSIDRERMRLAIALDYLEEARVLLGTASRLSESVQTSYSSAANYLRQVNPIGLIGKEYTQWLVARAYTLMSLERPELTSAKALLSEATEHDNAWGEKALLYLSMLEFAEGKPDVALRIIKTHKWSKELAPEALYQKIILSQSIDKPEDIIRTVQEATRLYPQIGSRPRIIGAQGIAYYQLKDWTNTIRSLEPLGNTDKLLPSENYALASAYYALEQYGQATPLFEKVATKGSAQLTPMAQFALGNIYAQDEDYTRAKLAYGSVVESTENLAGSTKEEALYRLIELNFGSGQDAFGKQTRLVERFLTQYPQSQYQKRVLDLLNQYCHTSTDYPGTLELLATLSKQGISLKDIRQEVLVRYANTLGNDAPEYFRLLEEAIALGPGKSSYPIALIMLGQSQIECKNYTKAEHNLRLAIGQHPWGERYEGDLAHYLLGYALYNQKKYAEALKSFGRYSQGDGEKARRADALARMGDCLTNDPKRQPEALKYYEEAIALGATNKDEAHRRIVGIYGLRGDYLAQIREADKFLSAYPNSIYLPEVMYLKGKALSLNENQKNRDEAHRIYSRVESTYPSSPYASLSALEKALLYSTDGDTERAIPAYKRVVKQYPTSVEAKTALSDLRTLYGELDRMDEYVSYTQSLERISLPEDHNVEELTLQGIQGRLRRGEAGAIEDLRNWTESHPKSPQVFQAQKLLAQTYIQKKQYQEASTLLGKMKTKYQASSQQLEVLELLATTHKALGNNAEMLKSYHEAYTLSRGDAKRRTNLALKLSQEAFTFGEYQMSLNVTTEELKSEGLPQEAKEKLTLTKGRTQEQLKAINGAIQTYATLAGSYKSTQGAEALVRRAELMQRLGQYKEAEELLEQFVESGTPQRYWLARGFITLSDCYAAQGEQYLAAQYLKNLKESYNNPEEDITEMIITRLKKIQN